MGTEESEEESSPTKKVKFLCSFGGKILPRPSDGCLKYVGGETRVVSIPHPISFAELMKKLGELTEGEMILKYQIFPEDLDALVSVRTDEDVKHMLHEHKRHKNDGVPKLRTFLFPSNPVVIENQTASVFDTRSVEQRYLDAVNGVLYAAVNTKLPPIITNHPVSLSISASSTPKSNSPDKPDHEGYQASRLSSMQKVQSSPHICGFSSYNHHYPQQHQYQSHHHSQYPSRMMMPPADHHGHPQQSHGANPNLAPQNYQNFGGSRGGYYEEYSDYGSGHSHRTRSVPQSPRKHGIRL